MPWQKMAKLHLCMFLYFSFNFSKTDQLGEMQAINKVNEIIGMIDGF